MSGKIRAKTTALLFVLWFVAGWAIACTAIWFNGRDVDGENAQLIELERRLVMPVTWTRARGASAADDVDAAAADAGVSNAEASNTGASNAGAAAPALAPCDRPAEQAGVGPCSELTCSEKARICSALSDALQKTPTGEKKSERKERDKPESPRVPDEPLSKLLQTSAERPVLEHTFQSCCVGRLLKARPSRDNPDAGAANEGGRQDPRGFSDGDSTWPTWDRGVPGAFWATVLATLLALAPFAVFALGRSRAGTDAPIPPPIVILNSFLSMAGWFYVLQPYRGAAAVAVGQLRRSWAARDFWFNYPWPDGPAPALMAGFLGWYIHMATVAWLRLYRNDVASVKIHGRFLSRALMIFGFALVLSPVPQAVSVPLAFLLGIFPFALPSLVTGMLESLGLKTKSGELAEGDLIALPGLSRLDVRRLHEEGIETLAQLATMDAKELSKAVPMYKDLPRLWIDMANAKLMAFWAKELREDSLSDADLLRLLETVLRLAPERFRDGPDKVRETRQEAIERKRSFAAAVRAYEEALEKARKKHEAEHGGVAMEGKGPKPPQDDDA